MFILNENNKVLDTNQIDRECHYSVLRFKDYKNPDFYFERLNQIDVFTSVSVWLEIGPFRVIMPLRWSVLCSDMEYVQSIPLFEISGIDNTIFCLNPIDGYIPHYLPMRVIDYITDSTWTCPPLEDKDMLVVPLGVLDRVDGGVERGPVCAIFGPNRIDISRPLSDIW